jgi:hypothetical protein
MSSSEASSGDGLRRGGDRIEQLWHRFVASRTLTPEERRELLEALERDPELRRTCLADLELEGLLRSLGTPPEQ